ncbi:potassium efflux system protein/small-conductance mechanosensitive channel [Lacticaseibacillus paracasei]|nr:potassium efflux system protein/small-conductance mechanosensitive channel [Lacticaseibacillus paracasei]EKQ23822.1 potassium efflux system protein/small-conductance mechanosensitive channel [Lacticaseibacillus paracasei]
MIHMIVTATTVNEQTNVWLKYFTTIDWDKIVGTFIDKVLSLLFFTVLFLILYRLGRFALNRTFKSYQRRAHLTGTRVKTIHALSVNVFSIWYSSSTFTPSYRFSAYQWGHC